MGALNILEVKELSDKDYGVIRESIFFNEFILPKAKSESLLTIFKLEHGLSLSDKELFELNEQLNFIKKALN